MPAPDFTFVLYNCSTGSVGSSVSPSVGRGQDMTYRSLGIGRSLGRSGQIP